MHNDIVKIRKYQEKDAQFLAAIYFNTIHLVNSRDYSLEQINAWAPKTSLELAGWIPKWRKCPPQIAVIGTKIVGFVELESNGHIDCFYCHHEHQGCGVGSALMEVVENKARESHITKLFSEVSITAKTACFHNIIHYPAPI